MVRTVDYFFHAVTTKYQRRFKGAVITVLVPLFGICVFCTVIILLNLGSNDIVRLMALIIAGCVVAGTAAVFVAAFLTYKYTKRHNRFTYLDILPDGFIFSLYAGEFYGRQQTILRKLYYIPFSGISGITRDEKKSPCSFTVSGEIRYFFYESSRLGYHVDEDNHTIFDSHELNERGFTQLEKLEISGWFGSSKRIVESIEYYLGQYRAIPEKKPFNLADHITRKRKKPQITSNPMLDAPSYDRKWD